MEIECLHSGGGALFFFNLGLLDLLTNLLFLLWPIGGIRVRVEPIGSTINYCKSGNRDNLKLEHSLLSRLAVHLKTQVWMLVVPP